MNDALILQQAQYFIFHLLSEYDSCEAFMKISGSIIDANLLPCENQPHFSTNKIQQLANYEAAKLILHLRIISDAVHTLMKSFIADLDSLL